MYNYVYIKYSPNSFGSQNTINEDEVAVGELVARGSMGNVYGGKWKGMDVIVKIRYEAESKEIEILAKLGFHPNIIHVHGVVYRKDDCLLVTEVVKHGTLFKFLYIKKCKPSHDQQLDWMRDIAMGMYYLHQHNIAHLDLNSVSVLLGNRMAKLSNFRSARYLEQTTTQSGPKGAAR